jgi:hypothetical protein
MLAASFAPLSASASPINPKWAAKTEVNEAYLSDVGHRFKPRNELNELFTAEDASRLQQRFEQINGKYERMKVYGTYTPTHQAAELDEIGKYRDEVQGSIESSKRNFYLKRVKAAAMEDPNINHLKGPLGIIFGIAAIYNGLPVQWKVSEETRLSASTQKGKSAQMQMTTSLVTGTFQFSKEAASDSSPYEPSSADPLSHAERYKFGAERELDFWDMKTSMTYGTSTKSVTTALTKVISKHLSASLEQIHPIKAGETAVSSNEGRVRMDYQLHF